MFFSSSGLLTPHFNAPSSESPKIPAKIREDLNREFEWLLPDDEATTIAGLVLHEARMIPEPGQVFVFYGFRFEILRRQRNQITLLRVTPQPAEGGQPAP